MKQQFKKLQKEFVQKVEQLENTKAILKTEFVGIDDIIDKIVDNVRSWYTMSFIQERPSVLNLWGLTGVGKTSVVLRLMELIDYKDLTFRLDLGEKEGSMSFRNSLADLCENKSDAPIVIILDEFQHARTLKGSGPFKEEIENDKNRMVWELIDSGKVSYIGWKRGLWTFEDLLTKLKKMASLGVEVENGIVVKGKEIYLKECYMRPSNEKELHFFPLDEYESIISLAGEELNLELFKDVEEILMKMNGPETIEFLMRVFRIAQRPSLKNFSKSLIVILGNIDEAYTMSSNYSTEISADDFYEQSLKITVPQMKVALRMRFRDEQIARLGNTHIIYPSLNKKAFYDIIENELTKITVKMKEQVGILITFDQTVKDILYKEGVYPTQGARPLLTTIQALIKSRISVYLNTIIGEGLNTDVIRLHVADEHNLVCEYFEKGKRKFTQKDRLDLNLEPLRKSKNDELQAITAVHESGHAVLSAALLQVVPELIVSVTSDTNASGYVYSKNEKKFLTKADIIRHAAVILGGTMAEEIVFGKELVTTGGSIDLKQATSLIMNTLKNEGMGSMQISCAKSNNEDSLLYHNFSQVEEEAIQLLQEARELAMNTLFHEKKALLIMAGRLANSSRLEKKEINELLEEHLIARLSNFESHFTYRMCLIDQLIALNSENEKPVINLQHRA
jgi:cell division protease FtsH